MSSPNEADQIKPAGLTRRAVLVSTSAAAGALMLGFAPATATAQVVVSMPPPAPAMPSEVTCWIVIQPDDTVVIRLARSEMGQGAYTALPMLVAEELECNWAKVKVEFVPPSENQRRKMAWQERLLVGAARGEEMISHWGSMATTKSQSTRLSQLYLRQAGATARGMLVEAAAKTWNVSAFDCTVAGGIITHKATNRTASFSEVAVSAARIPPPTRVVLKDPKTWKLAGQPTRQLDTRAKIDGSLQYAIDVRLPDMLHAAIVQCPVFGGKLAGFEPDAVKARPGVRQVIKLDDRAVCVIADSYWQAKTALDALPLTWDEGPNANASSASISADQHAGLASNDAVTASETGDVVAALLGANRIIEAEYSTPFLHHAALEPMCCTAQVSDGRVEIWAGTQDGEATHAAAAEAAGDYRNRVDVNLLHVGGGFGRRGAINDVVRYAVLAAKQTSGRPVKLLMSREEDMTHGFYRPASHIRFKAALDDKKNVTGLYVRIAGQSINAWHRPRSLDGQLDRAQADGFRQADFGYQIANRRVEVSMRNTPVPPGWWRSENNSQNAFYRECFIDELARAAGKDPLQFRKSMLVKVARPLRVLDVAAEKAGWSSAPAKGVFRGLALEQSFGSAQATIAEVSLQKGGDLRVLRIVNALDCGNVVNPNSILQQMTGATVMALTAMQFGAITIEKGRVRETNFDTYRMLRLSEMPLIENHIVGSLDGWGGVGSASLPSIAPAICNAIFAATGKRIRTLPLKNQKLTKT